MDDLAEILKRIEPYMPPKHKAKREKPRRWQLNTPESFPPKKQEQT
jgi:hypothetical protein